MKQFLTLCMATAMIGSALNADAKVMSWQQANQLKSEGKAIKPALPMRDSQALKTLKQAPVSGFHKMMANKDAKMNGRKAPSKVTPMGDNIYGYLSYAEDVDIPPLGLYELETTTATMMWADPFVEEGGSPLMNVALVDGKVAGYSLDSFFGYIFGIYYLEYDFNTGEPLVYDEQDLGFNVGFMQVFTYNPEDETYYGYGASADGTPAFVSAPASEPFNYNLIKEMEGTETCMSMCFNPTDNTMYGVNLDYDFVKVNTDGSQTVVMHLDVPDGATYMTGLVYDPNSNVYYWNINYEDETSAMATINPATQELNVYAQL